MMRLAVICLVGVSVMSFPCAYDTDPRDPSAMTAIVAKLFSEHSGATASNQKNQDIR